MSPASIQTATTEGMLGGVDQHPHARALLLGALPPNGNPSHAYLFHGPGGTGKRTAARAFAAALLADGTSNPEGVVERVGRDAHPDLTWVTPSGASEVLVSDIDEAVVGAVAHTPFESKRRVFVIEAAGTMNDQAANRLLKTLEEPPAFAHLILLAEHSEDVLPTIASRCQQVRFDPLASEVIEQRLITADATIDPTTARACARLAAGDGRLAKRLVSKEGAALRECAERFARGACGEVEEERPWVVLLDAAKAAGTEVAEGITEHLRAQAEMLPSKERRKHEREGGEVVRRGERRARTETLDLGLRLVELWLRDAWCVAVGAVEVVLASDRLGELGSQPGRDPSALLAGVERVRDTRLRLGLNVSEELALEALFYRLAELLSD
ncbi:MAG: ATP-binding protein [Solirubrobacteraceae bacterium]